MLCYGIIEIGIVMVSREFLCCEIKFFYKSRKECFKLKDIYIPKLFNLYLMHILTTTNTYYYTFKYLRIEILIILNFIGEKLGFPVVFLLQSVGAKFIKIENF